MKRLLITSLFVLTSCSLNLKTSHLGEPEKKSSKTVNYVQKDLTNFSTETILFDHYRSLNVKPLIIQNKLMFTTKNGRFFSYDLQKKNIIEKVSYCYGTNLSPLVYQNKLFLFSSIGKETIQMFRKGKKIASCKFVASIDFWPH